MSLRSSIYCSMPILIPLLGLKQCSCLSEILYGLCGSSIPFHSYLSNSSVRLVSDFSYRCISIDFLMCTSASSVKVSIRLLLSHRCYENDWVKTRTELYPYISRNRAIPIYLPIRTRAIPIYHRNNVKTQHSKLEEWNISASGEIHMIQIRCLLLFSLSYLGTGTGPESLFTLTATSKHVEYLAAQVSKP